MFSLWIRAESKSKLIFSEGRAPQPAGRRLPLPMCELCTLAVRQTRPLPGPPPPPRASRRALPARLRSATCWPAGRLLPAVPAARFSVRRQPQRGRYSGFAAGGAGIVSESSQGLRQGSGSTLRSGYGRPRLGYGGPGWVTPAQAGLRQPCCSQLDFTRLSWLKTCY